jgi:flagellar biosynthesis component FlhA
MQLFGCLVFARGSARRALLLNTWINWILKEAKMDKDIENDVLGIEIGKMYIKWVNKIIECIDIIRKRTYRIHNVEIPPVRIIESDKIEKDSYRIWVNGKIIKTRRVGIMRMRKLSNDFEKVVLRNLKVFDKSINRKEEIESDTK